jgi:hypothetical protein
LQKFIKENALCIFFIFSPFFLILNDVLKFTFKSTNFLAKVLSAKSGPPEPFLVAFGVTFPGYKTEDIEDIKALIEQCVINGQALNQIIIYQLLHQVGRNVSFQQEWA